MLPSTGIFWSIMEETKTLPDTWKTSLNPLRLLKQLTSESGRSPRIAILGVGNQFRWDDAAGVLIARALSKRTCALDTEHVLIIEAGHAPENTTAELRKFAPDLVLIVDAAEMGERPGTVQWIPEEAIAGMSASTHSLPLSMLARYLTLDLGCTVTLLGIQPGSNEIGDDLSAEVSQAIQEIVNELDKSFQRPL
jgi:hydrogenase 3 maturation protease